MSRAGCRRRAKGRAARLWAEFWIEQTRRADVWHCSIVTRTWFMIGLSHLQVAAWTVGRLEEAFEALFLAAGSPRGAALFTIIRDDGGEDLYFTPSASALARKLLKANGGQPSDPPVDDGTMALLVGNIADRRLLSS
jgi:hypothetical protein